MGPTLLPVQSALTSQGPQALLKQPSPSGHSPAPKHWTQAKVVPSQNGAAWPQPSLSHGSQPWHSPLRSNAVTQTVPSTSAAHSSLLSAIEGSSQGTQVWVSTSQRGVARSQSECSTQSTHS